MLEGVAEETGQPESQKIHQRGAGIEGEILSGPDFSTFAPQLKLKPEAAGVMVRWSWQGYGEFLDSCEIHMDRNDRHARSCSRWTPRPTISTRSWPCRASPRRSVRQGHHAGFLLHSKVHLGIE